MQNLTLQQLFGQNATQTVETLTIHKADLPGLTASSDNQGEQLLAALLLQAHRHFEGVLTDEQGRRIIDEKGRSITHDNRALYEKLHLWFWKRQLFNFYQINTFVVDVFILPPTQVETPLNPEQLNY